jgi:hypothetical protein
MKVDEAFLTGLITLTMAALFLAVGCAAESREGDGRISYFLAEVEGDRFGVELPECEVDNPETYTYRYPNGNPVTVLAAREALFTLRMDDSVSVLLLDFTSAELPEVRAVLARVIPPPQVLEGVAAVRDAVLFCDVLVVLDGKPVEIERSGRDWSRQLPGGHFSSLEAARIAFSGSRAAVRSEVPIAEIQTQVEFWRWRRQRDLWEFHCDSTLSEAIREKDPDLYQALSRTPAPDCLAPPAMPESAATGEH